MYVLQQATDYVIYYRNFGLCNVHITVNYGLGNLSQHSIECVKYYRNYYCVQYYSKLLPLWCRRIKYRLYKILKQALNYWMHNNTLKNVLCITANYCLYNLFQQTTRSCRPIKVAGMQLWTFINGLNPKLSVSVEARSGSIQIKNYLLKRSRVQIRNSSQNLAPDLAPDPKLMWK